MCNWCLLAASFWTLTPEPEVFPSWFPEKQVLVLWDFQLKHWAAYTGPEVWQEARALSFYDALRSINSLVSETFMQMTCNNSPLLRYKGVDVRAVELELKWKVSKQIIAFVDLISSRHERGHFTCVRVRVCNPSVPGCECELVPSAAGDCRLGFGTAAWEAGKSGAGPCCDTACCVKTQSSRVRQPQHTETERNRAQQPEWERHRRCFHTVGPGSNRSWAVINYSELSACIIITLTSGQPVDQRQENQAP